MTKNNNQQNEAAQQKKAEHELLHSDAELQQEAQLRRTSESDVDIKSTANTNNAKNNATPKPYRFIPLSMSGRTHVPSQDSRDMILNEVSLKDLTRMTERFYELAFQDKTLDTFITSHKDPHEVRFSAWIHSKLSGSTEWDKDRQSRGPHCPVHDRSSAHVAAWYSKKRPAAKRGNHFELDDCRVWMRLHFWALRDSGLMEQSPTFADYYVRFIAHFVRVYESTAPAFARDSLRWSANPKNIERYIQNGRVMKDVLNLSLNKALNQLPDSEIDDPEWPYHQFPLSS